MKIYCLLYNFTDLTIRNFKLNKFLTSNATSKFDDTVFM